jgi:MoaA/NifB/PqqE/SkfB family radical SAM enzyme
LRCNLSCSFCDTTERHQPARGELPTARWLELIEEAAEMGAKRLMVLGGGEPMISLSTMPLLRRAKSLGLEGMLTTNGTLMPRPVLAELVEIGWDEVHFSVDGAEPDTHDRLRGRSGAFRKTVSAACRLRQLRGDRRAPRIALHTVLTRENWREIGSILKLASSLGAFRVDVDALVAYRPEQQELALNESDKEAFQQQLPGWIALAESLSLPTTLPNFLGGRALERGVTAPTVPTGAGLAAAPCLKAWHHLTIQADGRLSPCCVLAGEGESLAEGSLAAHWRSSPMLEGVRAGMRRGKLTGRCAECSENILVRPVESCPPPAGWS